jgi:hypothetical protein
LPATMGTVLSVSNGSDYVGIAYDHFCKQLSGTMYDGSPVFFAVRARNGRTSGLARSC